MKKTYIQVVNFKREILQAPRDSKLCVSRLLAVLISPLNHHNVVLDLRQPVIKHPLSAV